MEPNKLVHCRKCRKLVDEMRLFFHETTCNGSHNPIDKSHEKKSDWKSNFITPKKISEGDEKNLLSSGNNSVVCPKCTAKIDIDSLDYHIENCDYKKCGYCKEYFPEFIMEQHVVCCDQRQSERLLRTNFDEEMSEADVYEDSEYSEDQSSISLDSDENEILHNSVTVNNNGRRITTTTTSRVDLNGNRSIGQIIQEEPETNTRQGIMHNNGYNYRISANQRNLNDRNDNITQLQPRTETRDFFLERLQRNHAESRLQRQMQFPNEQGRVVRIGNDYFHERPLFGLNRSGLGLFLDDHREFVLNNRNMLTMDFIESIMNELYDPQTGMSEREIQRIPLRTFRKQEGIEKNLEEKCAVCLTEFEDKEKVRDLTCKHIFHPSCIDTWLVQNSTCPVCKHDINKDMLN